jgi:RecF/RecN/SMC family protein
MKIKSLHFQDFKRFHDLTISEIPPAKLVVLTGPNGSGKSSVFDGLLQWKLANAGLKGYNGEDPYYSRNPGAGLSFKKAEIEWYGEPPILSEQIKMSIDVRSSYRHEPAFRLEGLSAAQSALDEIRLLRLIEQDTAVSKNYQRLMSNMMKFGFDSAKKDMTLGDLQKFLLSDINKSMKGMFGSGLSLVDMGDPLNDGTFYFKKGTVARFPYLNLSGGEKAAFDLVLDLSIKKLAFQDTVFCIDEPEAHMSTRLQAALLGELVRLIPNGSQLWIATHSIGMMRKAQDLHRHNPNQVAFIDFGNRNLDGKVHIVPSVPNRAFWKNVLAVALDDLSGLVVPDTIVVCEGNPRSAISGKNQEHDARCYSTIFEKHLPDVEFISAGNSKDVQSDRLAIMASIKKIAHGVQVIPLIDRDDHAPSDVSELNRDGYRVLSRRHIESYLFDDEVLEALCRQEGQPAALPTVKALKSAAIDASVTRGNSSDDIKKAAGEIVNGLRQQFKVTARGNSTEAFERNVLAPLIVPGTKVYADLKRDIFGT